MDVVEEIKRKLDLAEFIGRTVRLQKSGRSLRGLCPFHSEKTPSFYVFPDRGTWRCFGTCGEGGDLFTFAQKRDNLDFRGALRQLAAEAGIQLSPEAAQRRSRVERLAGVVSAAVDYYQKRLTDPSAGEARDYVHAKRGLLPETIEAFRIGWAPEDWHPLHDYLAGRGYGEDEALAAGLLVKPESGGRPHDRFRGRIIIPIADERGQFIGLGGRSLHGEEPKYLNSPQSDLFDKGRTLFGLDLAGDAIRATGTAVVVEGYMDVIGPWQAGFRNLVATMGTSLTENHAALLQRYAKRIVLAMDPDAAGMAAAERAGGLFLSLASPEMMARSARSAEQLMRSGALELRVAPLPAGKDPDEVARENPAAWEKAIANALPFAEFLLNRLMETERPESPQEARQVVDRLRPVLLAVADPVERAMYVQRIARRLGVTEQAVLERVRQGAGPPRRNRPSPARVEAPSAEQTLLAILVQNPLLRAEVRQLPPDLFASALDREAFLRWVHAENERESPEDPVAEHLAGLSRRRLPPFAPDDARRAVREKIREIGRDRLIQRQMAVTEELATAERTLGANRVAEVSNEVWRGALPPDESMALAETVIEELELGLSIHRREEQTSGR
ncbi:DNA primase [bacterium]|nr:MAG: DNA primase [bacterium]MCL4232104.1 DNA primase [Dehalococcoidia bacterium]